MPKDALIQDLLILRKNGTILFSQNAYGLEKSEFLGGFVSTISAFFTLNEKKQISSINLESKKISVCHCDNTEVMIVASCSEKAKDKFIFAYLEKIRDILLDKYQYELTECLEDDSILEDLRNYIDLKNDKENWLGVRLDEDMSKAVLNLL